MLLFMAGIDAGAQTRAIVPRASGEGSVGTTNKHWGTGYFDTLFVSNVSVVGAGGAVTGVVASITNTDGSLTYSRTTNSAGNFIYNLSVQFNTPSGGFINAQFFTNSAIYSGLVPGYDMNQATQTFIVPAGVTQMAAKAWAGGGSGGTSGSGGAGGWGYALFQTTPGETLVLIVGKGGLKGVPGLATNAPFGGFGAGSAVNVGQGAGFSGIFSSGVVSQASAIFIVGGGGGGGGTGGAGGSTNGADGTTVGTNAIAGTGGTQSAGGVSNGIAFFGGNAYDLGVGTTRSLGGGGGGYYGGGGAWSFAGGTTVYGGGGGGSSYKAPTRIIAYSFTRGNNTGDPDWQSPWGNGGASGVSGSDGAIQLWWNAP